MAEGSKPIYDLPVVSSEYDVLQFPVDQNNVAKRVYATDLADYFKNTVILENTIQNMDLSVSMTAGEIYDLVKDGQIVLFDSGFLESNSTVSCLFPIHRVEKNGNDYTAFVYVQNDIDDPVYEYAIDKFGGVNLIGESSDGAVDSVNGQTGVVVLDAVDVGALPDDTAIPTKTSDLTNDSGFITSADIPAQSVTSVNGKTGAVVLNATDVGAMPNTYTAPVTSVNGMTGDVVVSGGGGGAVDSVNGQTGVVVLTASDVGAVAAESGKGLSTNDFTTAEKNKLSGIASGAEVNVQADWNQTNTSADDFIKNKPTKLSEFTNDSGFITSASVPTKTSELTNDSGFITAQDVDQNNSIILTMDSNLTVKRDSTNITGSGIRTLFTQKYDVILYESSTNTYYQQGKADSVSAYFYNVSDSFVTIVTVPSGSSTATKTSIAIGGGGGSGNFVLLWANEDAEVVNAETNVSVTGADVADFVDRRLPVFLVDNDEGRLYEFTEMSAGDAVFTMVTASRVYSATLPSNSNIVNYDRRTITTNVMYYIDGTTVKSAETNLARTGQNIQDETLAKGIAPIIYRYDSNTYSTDEYHLFNYHSGGLNFRTLDGKKLIFVPWNSSTATITQSAGWAANILFYLDGTTVKYSGTNTAVTGNDVTAITLAVGIMPVIRQTINGVDYYYYLRNAHSGGLEFRLLDGTKDLSLSYNSSTATVAINYYAVTLNADGTVNTFDSALTYSAASASVTNGNPKKLIVTWGNSIFTADSNEKLSGVNGDVKFITDVEHDGIQRHMIFTLTSANALQTTLIETYARVPITVWEVQDVTQGLIALNTNISSSLAWQLTGLNLAPFKRIKIYVKAGRKTGALSADSSITPASIIEMSMDDRAKENASQNVFIGSSVVQNPNDPNRLGIITCAVSGDKTKFAVVRATTLYGTAATSNTDAYPYVFKIEGYYD